MPWPTPDRWDAGKAAHGVTRLEVWSQGEQIADIKGESGGIGSGVLSLAVTEKRANGIRMSLSMTVEPSTQWISWSRLPRLEIRPWFGLSWGTSEYLCPWGRFPVDPPELALPRTDIQIAADDYWTWVQRFRYVYPIPADQGLIRVAAEKMLNATGFGTTLNTLTSNASVPKVIWDSSVHDVLMEMMPAVDGECFVDREGTPILRDNQYEQGGSLTNLLTEIRTSRDYSNVINYIAVVPSGSESFYPGLASITDPEHPAHQSKIGPRGMTYSSPYITNRDQAEKAAKSILRQKSRPVVSWSGKVIPDPSLMVGDRITAITGIGSWALIIDTIQNTGTEMSLTMVAP